MKEYQLSKPVERILSVVFCIVMIGCMGLLTYALRNNTMLMILCGLFGLLLSVLMIFSVVSILKSKCIYNPETKTMEVRGFSTYTVDLSKAVLLQTLSRKSGQVMNRVLIFSDVEETVIATIPTMFTTKQGLMAEPLAKEMAKDMGIDFQANVPEWEYDKEKYEEHLKEEAEQAKKDRKERAELRKKKLLYRYRKK